MARGKLANPEFLPTADYVEPRPHVVPLMSAAFNLPGFKADVWKVAEPEIETLCEWLAPRLKEKHPLATNEGIVSFLRGAMVSPKLHLIRTENVVGAFEAILTEFDPAPIVRERWVRMKAQANEECFSVYRAARRWSKDINAKEFQYGFDTDLVHAMRYEPFKSAKKRDYYMVQNG